MAALLEGGGVDPNAHGVSAEALAAKFMAAETVRAILAGELDKGDESDITYLQIAKFYYPLALTSLIGLTVQPLLTFFMGRSVSPVKDRLNGPGSHELRRDRLHGDTGRE